VPSDAAYQLIHDELLLDGSAGLNLATFVTTWMEPNVQKLMAECFDKSVHCGQSNLRRGWHRTRARPARWRAGMTASCATDAWTRQNARVVRYDA
jgi:hypothetical protein